MPGRVKKLPTRHDNLHKMLEMESKMKGLSLMMCMVMLLGASLAGCSKNATRTHFESNYYRSCQEPLNYLANRGGMTRSVATGATLGGFLSGLTAVLVGAIGGRINPAGVVTSMGVGAVVGGVGGGISHGANKEDNRMMNAYLEQIDGDISDIDTVEKAGGTVALQCYKKAFSNLLADMKSGDMPVAEGRERFSEILTGVTEADKYINTPDEIN